ncbi:hypothetical protein RU639_009956 [Aspergillus parasiticus]
MPSSDHGSSLMDVSHTIDEKQETLVDNELYSPTKVTYPEGGRDAWLVVLGAWCGLTASLGIYNTAGVFEVVVSKVLLPEYSQSTIGWIFSVYAFVNWVCGVQVGPTFDAMGPRALIIAGMVCTLIGIFALSVCTEYYQIFLSFSILMGIGSSLLLTLSMGCVVYWFMERRGLASGMVFIGGSFGGVIFPLIDPISPLSSQLCETHDYGRYYASCFTVVSFGVLASIPIAGSLLNAVEATGKEKYWGTVLFAGLSYVAFLLCFLWIRIKVKGWVWRIKW